MTDTFTRLQDAVEAAITTTEHPSIPRDFLREVLKRLEYEIGNACVEEAIIRIYGDPATDAGDSATKRVRILVAMDPSGEWSSMGCHVDDATTRNFITLDDLACGIIAYYWIEADIPVPVAPPAATIEGVVADGGSEVI